MADLHALETLDPKLWVALSCPVNDLEIDRRTLALIDHDTDRRVRIEEQARLRVRLSLFAPTP